MQSTYENFRYRYDQQVNPYNKGVVKNFKEVFCSIIPPSKNNFRAKVPIPKEPSGSSGRMGVDYQSPMMRKTAGDLELGRPWPIYNDVDEDGSNHKDGFTNDKELDKGSGLSDISVDLSRILHTEGGERQVASFLRNPSWERSSRKWDINPEVMDEIHVVGESKRITIDISKEPSGNTQSGSIMSDSFKDMQN